MKRDRRARAWWEWPLVYGWRQYVNTKVHVITHSQLDIYFVQHYVPFLCYDWYLVKSTENNKLHASYKTCSFEPLVRTDSTEFEPFIRIQRPHDLQISIIFACPNVCVSLPGCERNILVKMMHVINFTNQTPSPKYLICWFHHTFHIISCKKL